jgi:hypothetical protein
MRARARLTMLAGTTITIVAALGLPAAARPLPLGPSAAGPAVSGQLWAVSADSPADAWAVGRLRDQQSQVVLHWDGTAWASVQPWPDGRPPGGRARSPPVRALRFPR